MTNLHVFNPSRYPRRGYVATAWRPVYERAGIPEERVAVFDADGRQLDTQVHRADPDDPSRDALVFWLDGDLRPLDEDFAAPSAVFSVGEREREMGSPPLRCEPEGPAGEERRVVLSNGRLTIFFELAPDPWRDGRGWYAGSATSALLEPDSPDEHLFVTDMLDAFNFIVEHDQEKRCMQVDRVRLSLPAWAPARETVFHPFHLPYTLLSTSCGPVRASVCVASTPFEYRYSDPRGGERAFSCRLRRVISLYREANYVTDELSVRGTQLGPGGPAPIDLFFDARYFMLNDLGRDCKPSNHFRIWDWFGLCSEYAPRPAFGFATDAHCSPVVQGPDDYPDEGRSDKAFRWELERNDRALCVHLFARCGAREIERHAGRAWYEQVYRPLWAAVGGRAAAAPRSE